MKLSRFPKSGKRIGRHGTTMVETAFLIIVFVFLLVGMIDLGIGVFRYHHVAQVARQGARLAIVHGELAPPEMNVWGPATIDEPASNTSVEIVAQLQRYLISLNPSETRIRAEWLDNSTELERRVRVTVTTPYRPFTTWIFGNITHTLRSSSTMPIAH